MFKLLLKPFADMAGIYLRGKVDKAQAKSELELARLEAQAEIAHKTVGGELNWNQTMAEASASSWKDEWLTILVSIPLVLAFTGNTELVTRGFEALEAMPEFYQTAVGVVFAASFGIQKLTKMFSTRKLTSTGP